MPEEFDATRTSFTSSQTSPATPEILARYTDSSPAFGPYRLVKTLGEGGMGQVWEAEHQDTSRIVALKIAHSGLNSDEDRERFIREARLAASISHRNCVFVFGAVESNGSIAIAMELVRGGTVKDLVKDGKPIDPQEAVRIAIEMIDGLDAAHAKGILHRDIKPANIFIDSDSGSAKVGDFGLSTSITPGAAKSPELSTLASFAGTPSYASPEQLQGRDLDVRSDIYSVGATLYYLLAGRPPFTERDLITLVASISARNPEPPSKYNPRVPTDVDAVVLKCLAKNPAARYADYASFRNALTAESPAPIGRRLLAGMIDSLLADGTGWPVSRILWAGIDESPDRQLILLSVRAGLFLLRSARRSQRVVSRQVGAWAPRPEKPRASRSAHRLVAICHLLPLPESAQRCSVVLSWFHPRLACASLRTLATANLARDRISLCSVRDSKTQERLDCASRQMDIHSRHGQSAGSQSSRQRGGRADDSATSPIHRTLSIIRRITAIWRVRLTQRLGFRVAASSLNCRPFAGHTNAFPATKGRTAPGLPEVDHGRAGWRPVLGRL